MRNFLSLNKTLTLIPFLVGFALLYPIQQYIDRPTLDISAQEKRISFSTQFFNFFHLGHRRLISSYMWIETLMNADHEHFDESDNQSSWLYYRFESIINLDERFYEAYLYGGQYLSILKDEPLGAERILDRGLERYPDDYWLHYYAAYNQYFELNNLDKARYHYRNLIMHPLSKRNPVIHSLYTRLLSDQSDLEDAFKAMKLIYEGLENEPLKRTFRSNLYRLRARIDLECLNQLSPTERPGDCRTKDLDGVPYLLIDGVFHTPNKKGPREEGP